MDWTHTTEERLFGSINILTEEQVEDIVQQAIRLLQTTGIQFDDHQVLDDLRRSGATIEGSTARFPREFVLEGLESLSAKVILGARDQAYELPFGHRRFLTTNGFGTMRIMESDGVTTRPATAMDLAKLTRLADAIDEVGYCQHQTTPQDIPVERLDVLQALAVLGNTSKHAHLSTYTSNQLDLILELGRIAGDGLSKPVFSLGCCSISPLRYPAEATEVLRRSAENGIPFLVVCGAVAGVMSPVTLAGTLVVQTAEHLAALVLAQRINPGTPILLGSFSSPMDPRNGMQRLAASELSLLNGATAQICERIGVPFGYGTGGVSDSTSPGVQTGIEKAFTILSCALAGVEVIHDAVSGILASGTVTSYEQMIIDAEVCRLVRRYVRGIDVNDETLAIRWIEEVGPGGNYAALMHTAKYFRKEICLSDLWESTSCSQGSILDRARDTVLTILEEDVRMGLSEDQMEAMLGVGVRGGLERDMLRKLFPPSAE